MMEGGGAHEAQCFIAEVLAIDKFWESKSHCLQLCGHCSAHQTPVASSKPMVPWTALLKLFGPSYTKTNKNEYGREICMKGMNRHGFQGTKGK